MNLTSYPADYASAYDDNLFCFEGVDAESVSHLTLLDGADTPLGERRYRGQSSLTLSPKAYLLAQLAPEPLPIASRLYFTSPSGRDASIKVGYNSGEEFSPTVLFTASHYPLSSRTPMCDGEEWRDIALGEQDEIALCVDEGTVVSAVLTSEGSATIPLALYTVPRSGVVLFCVNAEAAIARLGSVEGVEAFTISIAISSTTITKVHYRLVEAPGEGVRMAWLSERGYICYHTFPRPTSVELHCSRTLHEGSEATTVPLTKSWQELSLDSGVLSNGEAQRLSEIISSPCLWRYVNGSYEPQRVVSHKVARVGYNPQRVCLTIRPAANPH